MAVTRRYQPSHPEHQNATYAIDLAPMLPPGVAIESSICTIQINTTPPTQDLNMTVGAQGLHNRIAWATIQGGTMGTDYIMTWLITDSAQNTWIISTLLLCAATS